MLKRLKIKFVCINMALITGMLCVILGLVVQLTRESLAADSRQQLYSISHRPSHLSIPTPQMPEAQLPYFVVERNMWGVTTSSGYYDLSNQERIQRILSAALEQPEDEGVLTQYALRYRRVSHPSGLTIAFVDISSEEAAVSALITNCVFIGLAGFGLFLVLSLALASWAMRPVARAWLQQRQFVADASHELKTPLTVIMTNAELLENPQTRQERGDACVENILTMSRQMRRLVESLLELARADNGTAQSAFPQLDFSEAVRDAALPFEALFFEAGMTLESEISPGLSIRGSGEQLGQVVEILLDNAMKYAWANARVCLCLLRQGNRALLTVTNPGPELSQGDLKNIFKRFYRADKARSLGDGYGLGLSIAQTIVQTHRGRIWAESRNGYNTFFVQLPLL